MNGMTGWTWTFGFCETCLKNSHEKVKLVKRKIVSGDLEGKYSKEFWVCPVCGATKRL
ncbi:MAG: hypothetical protein QXS48_00520 [Candidatus Aenigmatarchaeota archaeon]